MSYSLAVAAAATGLNKTSILRAIKTGEISGTKDALGQWWVEPAELAQIMLDGEELRDGCGEKRAIHVANRCPSKLPRVSALRHSRHDRRYAASLRSSICPAQEAHS